MSTPADADAGTRAEPGLRSIPRMLAIGTVALCLVAPLVTFFARSGSEPPEVYPIFLRLFAFNDHIASIAVLMAIALALAIPRTQEIARRMAMWMGEHPALTVGAAFVSLALCSRFVYLAHPLSMDEYAPLVQAHAFAQGNLAAQYPPDLVDYIVPKGFQGVFLAVDRGSGDVVSKYWPGLALVMTPAVWLGATWCVNPAFGALALILIYRLVVDTTGNREAGGWAMLAALASPQFSINAISYYAMPGELALNLLFLWLLLRTEPGAALLAGLVGGLSLNMHNPAPHGLFALPCLLWLASDITRWKRLLLVLAGYLPMLGLGAGWSMVMSTVDAPANGTASAAHSIAGLAAFVNSFLTVPDSYMLMARWYATWKLWIWACPGLLLVLLVPRARGTSERLLIAGLAVTFLFFLFVTFDQGHGWGYRYVHGAWGALPVIAGLWLATASEPARKFAAAMAAAGLMVTPVYLWQTHRTVENELSWRLSPRGNGDWVVFVAQDTGRYRGDLVQNPPGQSNLLYLASRGDQADAALMRTRFPEARVVDSDHRGSAWRLPQGLLARSLDKK